MCDWSRAGVDPDVEVVRRLTAEVEKLTRHIRKFPSSHGRQYLKNVCEAAAAAITAISRIPSLLPRSAMTLIESYQWNQTRRIKDLPASPIEHLRINWERWISQLSDASEEIKRVANYEGPSDEDNESDEEAGIHGEDDDFWMDDLLRKITPSEISMAKECFALVKMCRSLLRKTQVKILMGLGLNESSFYEVQLIDELFSIGHLIVAEADNLAIALFPVQESFSIREMAIRLAKVAQNLAELGRMHTAEPGNQTWFDNCSRQFDKLIVPVLERTPFR